MKCQRCLGEQAATYRVFTEVINMKVCEACADEARRIGIAVEALDVGERKRNRQAS
jgi:protein-arginine kinase activator protein McsA